VFLADTRVNIIIAGFLRSYEHVASNHRVLIDALKDTFPDLKIIAILMHNRQTISECRNWINALSGYSISSFFVDQDELKQDKSFRSALSSLELSLDPYRDNHLSTSRYLLYLLSLHYSKDFVMSNVNAAKPFMLMRPDTHLNDSGRLSFETLRSLESGAQTQIIFTPNNQTSSYINDKFFIGTSDVLLPLLDRFNFACQQITKGSLPHSELLTYKALSSYRINLCRLPSSVVTIRVRSNGFADPKDIESGSSTVVSLVKSRLRLVSLNLMSIIWFRANAAIKTLSSR